MKKFFSVIFCLLIALALVACGKDPGTNGPTEEEINAKLREYKEKLDVKYAEGDTADAVTKDVTLIGINEEGVEVTWTTESTVITIDGNTVKVTRGEEDVKVRVTGKVTYMEKSILKPFEFTIKSTAPEPVKVTGITVTGDASAEVGDPKSYVANVAPEDAANKAVTWSTSDSTIATVDEDGVITPLAVGEVFVIATSVENPEISGEIKVTISAKVNLETIANVVNFEEGTVTKVNAGVVGVYAQGYLLYDDTGFILYYVGKDAELAYKVGDFLEVTGALGKYNGRVQFTNEAKVNKISDGYTYSFGEPSVYTVETMPDFLASVQFGKLVTVRATITSVSDSYVNGNIVGMEGIGVAVTYPLDKDAYVADKVFEITGYALYAKEYNNVNSLYLMEVSAGEVHKVTFDTGVEGMTVDPIEFSDYTKVELPELIREEYIFGGWQEGTAFVDELTENKDYNLSAYWVKREYESVSFELNGGKLVFDDQIVIRNYNNCGGIVKNYDSFTLYKKGSSTKAWASEYWTQIFLKKVEGTNNLYKCVKKAGSGTSIEDALKEGQANYVDYDYIVSTNSTNPDSALLATNIYKHEYLFDLYFYMNVPENPTAKCEIPLIYGVDKNAVNLDDLKFEENNSLPACSKDNYEFVGWYDNAEFNGEPVSFHTKGKTTYYAKFTPKEFAIEYELNEGTCADTLVDKYTPESEDIVLPTTLTKEGYEFVGWFDNAEGAGTAITKIAKGTAGDLKLYAIWILGAPLDLEIGEGDVKAINENQPTLIVKAGLANGRYTLKGTGLSPNYNDVVFESNVNAFASLNAALLVAKENDVIYVFAGEYAAACDVKVANLTIVGPNYGAKATTLDRGNEAVIAGLFDVYNAASGLKLDGLKFTGTVELDADDVTIDYCIINGPSARIGQDNRSGSLIGVDSAAKNIDPAVGDALTNLVITNCYFCNPAGDTVTYGKQFMSFHAVENFKFENNYITNLGTSMGSSAVELCIFYTITGTFDFNNNVINLYHESCNMWFGFTSNTATVMNFEGNTFNGKDGEGANGYMRIYSNMNPLVVNFIGNTFNNTTDETIQFVDNNEADSSLTATFKYNVFNNAFYGKAAKNSSLSSTLTVNATFDGNFFAKGVNENDTMNASAAINNAETAEAALNAYYEYAGITPGVIDYKISYVFNGETTATLVTTYNVNSEDIVLPTKDQMYLEDADFGGWYDNALYEGDPITVIAKGSTGNKVLYAKWTPSAIKTFQLAEQDAAAIAKYNPTYFVNPAFTAIGYKINGVQYLLGENLFVTLDEAMAAIKANEAGDVTIYVFAGEYTITTTGKTDSSDNYFQLADSTKTLKIVGPNYDKFGYADDRVAEAKLNMIGGTYGRGNLEFIGVTIAGVSATGAVKVGSNYFGNASTKATEAWGLSFINCSLYNFKSMIIFNDKTYSNGFTFDGCKIASVGQFILWTYAATKVDSVKIVNNYFDGAKCGGTANTAGALMRVRSSSNVEVYNNVFTEIGNAKVPGYFEFSGTTGTFICKYNTFNNLTKLVYASSTGTMQFDQNLYLGSEGAVLTEVPAYVTKGSKTTGDTTLATSEEDRASKYNFYLENGNKFDVEFVLDGGTCTETLPEFYYELAGANLPAASTMSKEGYTFVGWFDNANGIGEAMTAIVGGTKGNLQIYAIWKSNANLEVALNASDVAVLNTVTPTIVVVPTAPIAKVKLTGTELDSKYASLEYEYGVNLFRSLYDASAAIVDGSVIYVAAGTYANIIEITNKNVSIYGPNANINPNTATRNDEANFTAVFTIAKGADGVLVNGLSFTDGASFKVSANDLTASYNIIAGASTVCGANNRNGIITFDITINNPTLDSNKITVASSTTGYKYQWLAATGVNGFTFTNNVVTSPNATSSSNEGSMIYAISGHIVIANNKFNYYQTASALLVLGYNASNKLAIIDIINNDFNSEATSSGCVRVKKYGAGSVVNFVGNTLKSSIDEVLTFDTDVAATINVLANNFDVVATYTALEDKEGLTIANNTCNVAETKYAQVDAAAQADAVREILSKVTVYYFANGSLVNTEVIDYGASPSLAPLENIYARTGYKFVGWDCEPTKTITDYSFYVNAVYEELVTDTVKVFGFGSSDDTPNTSYFNADAEAQFLYLVSKSTANASSSTFGYAYRIGITYNTEKGTYVVDKIYTVNNTESIVDCTSDYVLMYHSSYVNASKFSGVQVGDEFKFESDLSTLAAGPVSVKVYFMK